MTHRTARILKAIMALTLAGLVVFGIRQDDVLAATFLFGYLCIGAYWALGRREE